MLGAREKVAKINAELARLELEMELDHGGEDFLGPKTWTQTIKDAVGLGESTKVRDEKKKVRTGLIESAGTGFSNNVLTAVSTRTSIVFTAITVASGRQEIIDKFHDKAKIEDVDALLFWTALFNGKSFYVIFRYGKDGVSEYNMSLTDKENFDRFSNLKFSSVVAVDSKYDAAVNKFISRVLQCVVSYSDLDKFAVKR